MEVTSEAAGIRLGPPAPAADPFFDAARIAAQIVSRPDGLPRRASFLRLDDGELTSIAEYDETGDTVDGHYALVDHPDLQRAVVGGEVVVSQFRGRARLSLPVTAVAVAPPFRASAMVPVHSFGAVIGLIAVDARDEAGFSEAQLHQLVTVANIVGLAIGRAAEDRALRDEAERSHALERLKGEFLNIAAHELRSPLGIINGYTSMLLEGMLSEQDQGAALARIAEKAAEMERLITEMLETARMEQLGVDLSLASVDLVAVIEEAITAMRPMLGPKHRLVVHGGGDPLPAIADHARLLTMLVNLIDNSIKYSPDGGDVVIEWGRIADEGHVSVTDHGVGIRDEQLPMLFTRFGRLVTPETSHIRGSGLGLYLAREIARLHGGDIVLASQPGQGTTFRMTMPLRSANA